MENIIREKMQQLRQEANTLTEEREALVAKLQKIETRLTQIVGAHNEMNNILNDLAAKPATPSDQHS